MMTLTIIAIKSLSGTVNTISLLKNSLKDSNCSNLISILKNSPDYTFNRTVAKLREALKNDLKSSPPGKEGFKLLLTYDKYSTRQFLAVYVFYSCPREG